MKSWIVAIVAALVITGLGGFLITRYGQARYDAGYLAAGNEQAAAQDRADADAKKDFDNVSRETNKMDDAAVDRDLYDLGIMRADQDR